MHEKQTSDLYFAAYLKVASAPLTDLRREGKRAFFVFGFESEGMFKKLKDDYFMDRAKVPALSYSQAVKAMKSLIYSE